VSGEIFGKDRLYGCFQVAAGPSGSKRIPSKISASVTAVVKIAPACCSASQSTTHGVGFGSSNSDMMAGTLGITPQLSTAASEMLSHPFALTATLLII